MERWYGVYPLRSSGPVWLKEGGAHYASIIYLDARGLDSYGTQRERMVRFSTHVDDKLRESTEEREERHRRPLLPRSAGLGTARQKAWRLLPA